MLELLKQYIPGWVFAVVLCVVGCIGAGFSLWAETHDPVAVVIGLACVIVGPGAFGVFGLKGKTPPNDPTATAPVTP